MVADILPECLIQEILRFLSFKEASKMSVLSKTWSQACSTLPYLEFTVYNCKGDIEIVDTVMERYRKGKITTQKFEFLKLFFGDSHHPVFPLIHKWLDIALQNGVKDLVLDYTSYPTPISKIFAAKSIRKLVLRWCTLLYSGVVNCNFLRKLSLYHVNLDENMVQIVFNSCPLLVSFILDECLSLDHLELVNLQKIKSVFLKVLKIWFSEAIWEIDAPNLVSFEYMGKKIPELTNVRRLEHSKIILYLLDNINADWFCKLRKFLSNSTSWSQVTLDFYECADIKMEHLQQHHRVAIPQVDVLEVYFLVQHRQYSSFVGALVWSCLPRRLNLQPINKMFTVFVDHLMYMKNERIPWHSKLKDIKAFDGKNQLLQLGSEERAERPNIELEKVYFLLDW